MWQTVPKIIFWWVIGLFFVGLSFIFQEVLNFIDNQFSPSHLVRMVGAGIAILDVGFVIFFNFVWKSLWRKWPLLAKFIFPDISGEWKGRIQWRDGENVESKEMSITIIQKWSRFVVVYGSDGGESQSNHVWIKKDLDTGKYTLAYEYVFKPNEIERAINAPHDGVARLNFKISDPDSVSGSYCTTRGTTGMIELTRVKAD